MRAKKHGDGLRSAPNHGWQLKVESLTVYPSLVDIFLESLMSPPVHSFKRNIIDRLIAHVLIRGFSVYDNPKIELGIDSVVQALDSVDQAPL
jgi:hypothetical protein